MDRRTRPRFYYFANAVLRAVFRVLLRIDVRGVENVPHSGPLIIAMSHSSFIDPVVTGVNIPRDISAMAKVEAFGIPLLGDIIRWYGAFPVRRGEVDLAAFKTALQILAQGQAIIIAPEGHRSESGSLQRGREGAIMLALRSGAPILPVAVYGGKPFWKNLVRLRRTRMSVHIGAPVQPRDLGRKPRRAEVSAMADELMVHMARMMPVDIRGYYADLSGFSNGYLVEADPALTGQRAHPDQKEVAVR